ncbi:MAG TPA: hypothetical protein VNT26_01260, partial [Candidatus Sulfotelmatobacter sp.]|nr:hypothetical protein [Candidatus Sulfotelmatobacter sp.]
MNECARPPVRGREVSRFWQTAWPTPLPTDSEAQRRKKLAVRSGHLAMALLVLAGTGGMIGAGFHRLSWLQMGGLLLGAAVYL